MLAKFGAGDWIRTSDLLITNQLLYRLSYASILAKNNPYWTDFILNFNFFAKLIFKILLAAPKYFDEEKFGAGNGARTRNLQLGRLSLYQLSYSRTLISNSMHSIAYCRTLIFSSEEWPAGRSLPSLGPDKRKLVAREGFEPSKT